MPKTITTILAGPPGPPGPQGLPGDAEYSIASEVEALAGVDLTKVITSYLLNYVLRNRLPFIRPEDYGASGNGIANDSVAMQNTINASAGRTILLSGVYACSGLTVTRDVKFLADTTPGTDPTNSPLTNGHGFRRNGDAPLFTINGTNRTTGRGGRITFSGILFRDNDNVSLHPLISAKWADSLVFNDCVFWQIDTQTTCGHYIYAEECWDWRFNNTYFKHYGRAAGDKHAIYLFNGATDSCNDWQFHQCRWQEGNGHGIIFDSSGGGNNCFSIYVDQCKFEDTAKTSLAHITGSATAVFVAQTQFGGCGEAHIVQPSTSSAWDFLQCLFASNGASATEMIRLEGNDSSVKQSRFISPGAATAQYVNVIGNDNEVGGGNSRGVSTITEVNSNAPATTKVHHNPDFLTEYGAQAQITAGNTSVTIAHGLSYTPSNRDISITPASSFGAASYWWMSNPTSTHFTINLNVDPGTTVTFGWHIQRIRG